MNQPVQQHQLEIQRNQQAWANKPLLRDIYRDFYERIARLVDARLQGRILELGCGNGALRAHLPHALLSDLFPNAWLDLVADGYALPFGDQSLSHLILFDVFHHLRAPKAFLHEARRVLVAQGRIILVEPYISWTSLPVYSLLHHEPVAWREKIEMAESPPARDYYAAQGNATRLLFAANRPASSKRGPFFTARLWRAGATCFRAALANRVFIRARACQHSGKLIACCPDGRTGLVRDARSGCAALIRIDDSIRKRPSSALAARKNKIVNAGSQFRKRECSTKFTTKLSETIILGQVLVRPPARREIRCPRANSIHLPTRVPAIPPTRRQSVA